MTLQSGSSLPADWRSGAFLGRMRTPEGPIPILVVRGEAYDMSRVAPTLSALVERGDFSGRGGTPIEDFDGSTERLLAPIDLQCVKAAGVTFAVSAIERVIEERARGDLVRGGSDPRAAGSTRRRLDPRGRARIARGGGAEGGADRGRLVVAISRSGDRPRCRGLHQGARALGRSGRMREIGIRSDSTWNNPEPEIALLVDSTRQGGRRDARQRRQSARLRGALGAAAGQGEGQ